MGAVAASSVARLTTIFLGAVGNLRGVLTVVVFGVVVFGVVVFGVVVVVVVFVAVVSVAVVFFAVVFLGTCCFAVPVVC